MSSQWWGLLVLGPRERSTSKISVELWHAATLGKRYHSHMCNWVQRKENVSLDHLYKYWHSSHYLWIVRIQKQTKLIFYTTRNTVNSLTWTLTECTHAICGCIMISGPTGLWLWAIHLSVLHRCVHSYISFVCCCYTAALHDGKYNILNFPFIWGTGRLTLNLYTCGSAECGNSF